MRDQPTEREEPSERDGPAAGRCCIDLHSHTSASFDSGLAPGWLVTAAVSAGLTHIAITDHDTIDGALAARDAAPPGLRVIVGQEITTVSGDLIGLFLERAIPSGLSVADTSAAIREQGGVVGLPHPFDSRRRSAAVGLDQEALRELATRVDYVEVHNGRVRDPLSNTYATDLAASAGLPGVAVSDAHTLDEVGHAMTILHGDPRSARDLLRLLREGTRLKVASTDREPNPGPWSALFARLRR